MRILVCGINYAPDLIGVAKYNTELCEWFQGQGHEIRIVTAPPYYPEWEIPPIHRTWAYRSEIKAGVSIKRAPIYVPRNPSGLKRIFHHASFALTSVVPMRSEARSWRPHIVLSIAPSLMSSAMVASIARRAGAASWLHLQDFEVDAAFDLGLLHNKALRATMLAAERRILRSFDRVSTIAPQMIRRLESKGVESGKLREIRNWIDTDTVRPGNRNTSFRKELGLRVSDLIALYSGTMSNKQGLELIIGAAIAVARSHPNIHFILCGGGPQNSKLREMAVGVANVHFLGLQPDDRFMQLLNTADFHLIPQRAEAADLVLPSKIGGIFASGGPVIAMAAHGTGLADELIGAGLIVPPGDTNALVEAIRQLADNFDLRQALGNTARRRAVERWDKMAILSSLEQEFIALCGETGPLRLAPLSAPSS